jgi:peptidoglycan hydrolase-like protein with peptidoglycan-binding domain
MNTIKQGAIGAEVKQLQDYLKQLGYIISVDGNFGPGTYNTVVQFQTKMGLTADGVVGPKTWEALEKEVAILQQLLSVIMYDSDLEGKELLSNNLLFLFKKAGYESKNPIINVTSMWRSPAKQAAIMYDNISQGNIMNYAAPGKEVTQLIQAEIKKKTPKAQVIQLAEAKIIDLAKQNKMVSLHCVSEEQYQKKNIVDISKTRTPNPRDFVKALLKDQKIAKIITPFTDSSNYGKDKRVSVDSKEPAIHVEYTV